MQNNGGDGDAVSLTTAQMEDQQRKTRPLSDSWAKLLNSTHNNNSSIAASTHNPAASTATAAIWSSYGMMEGGGGGGGGGSTAMGCISNGSGASADREGSLSRIMFQAEPFPCGPFTRLLDPSANISPETIELGLEDFPSSSGNVPVAAAAASSLPQLQVPTQPVPSLRSPASFGSSSILTFHSNMNKPEVAYPPNPRQKPTGAGSPSSSSTSSNTTVQKSTIEEGECNTEQKRSSEQAGLTAAPGTCNTSSKKSKSESSGGPMKVRKEKLGERINALQQLVSPYGKTDTASVLQEAMGYIKFLQDQVQVLSTPYLKGIPSSQTGGRGDQAKYDLRSRGLCLVPVSCTLHVANNNGADFWTSGIGSGSKF